MSTLEELEAGLRASQDRDLASVAAQIRAQTLTLQALAITQSEHTRVISALTERIRSMTDRLGGVESALDRVGDGQNRIVEMLNTLIDRDS